MMDQTRKSPLIFLHVPKTAGSTFHSVLSIQYFGKATYWTDPLDFRSEIFKSLPLEDRLKIDLLRGHIYYGLHEFLRPGAKYITLLRDPLKRIISYWNYAKSEADRVPKGHHWWTDAVREQSFKEFITSGKDVDLENGQLRRILGFGKDRNPCSENDLQMGINNINKHFVVAGLQEHFDESLALMAVLLNWERPLFYGSSAKVRLRGNHEVKFSKSELNLIRERNEMDFRLCAYVQKRFEDQWEANEVAARKRLKQLQKNQKLTLVLKPIIELKRKLRL